ncbi:uncharacterized protein LOC133929870 [Phragmites australis]|uniref:uncharacterized protein LOC133929870 n=1 Tax=Phragmites australis TaxID=29695 RepID=UPI002D77F5DB|nr:uncharacterized protein LOC133929870 [Phragmites australis]
MGMADANKRINLAAPLLTVRRHGAVGAEDTATALPSYKPSETSGPLGRTCAVPFGWEHRPGHPKSVRTRRPPPPPPTTLIDEASCVAPEMKVVDAAAALEEERFSDARSRDDMSCVTVNCSVTGLSDAASACAAGAGPGARGSVMMDRFLPAAHAVAAGCPQCTFRKAASAQEPARPTAASALTGDGDRSQVQRRLPLQHIPTKHLPPLSPEDKNDDAESDAPSTRGFASKRCGLLPTRCVKNTLQLLNPAPAMRRGARGARRGAGGPFLSNGSRSQRAMNPLLHGSRNGQQQSQNTGGHYPGMQSWEVKLLLRSGRSGLTAPATAVASELDRTVRKLYRDRGAEAVHQKASHPGLLLVLDRSSEERHSSSAQNLSRAAETALPLPPPKTSRNAEKKLRRGAAGYGFSLLLKDEEVAAGREIVLSPQPLLPLPLPKSPSESWLLRALPSVSTRPPATSFLGLHVQARKHAALPWCCVDHARQRQIRVHDLHK